jgi:large subunit ribosomal protein L28
MFQYIFENFSCNCIAVLLSYKSCLSAQSAKGGASYMAKCQFCDKDVSFGIKVSHSHRRSNRTWKPNVKRVKAIVDGKPQHVYACTRCLRSGKVTRAV